MLNSKLMNLKVIFDEDYVIETTWDRSPMRKNTYTKTTVEELKGRELAQIISEKSEKSGLKFERAKLTKKERFQKIEHEYKKLFKKGDSFELKPRVNLFVGDNGCGKSTLIKLLLKNNKDILKDISIISVDMEESNPKITNPNPSKGTTYNLQELSNMFMWSTESHGETREGVLLSILSLNFDLLILDEPEQGLFLKNQLKYINKPIIICTHSKVFIENVEEVFDVESMKWINTKKYLKSILS